MGGMGGAGISPDQFWQMNWAEYMLLMMDLDADPSDGTIYCETPEDADRILFG